MRTLLDTLQALLKRNKCSADSRRGVLDVPGALFPPFNISAVSHLADRSLAVLSKDVVNVVKPN